VGLHGPALTPVSRLLQIPIMATMIISDLPSSRALDYKAMSAIRGAGSGDWVLYAFQPTRTGRLDPADHQLLPDQQLHRRQPDASTENINVNNSAPNASINVGADQNALTANIVPVSPHT